MSSGTARAVRIFNDSSRKWWAAPTLLFVGGFEAAEARE